MTPEEMCNSCKHRDYCIAAGHKDFWCGNHSKEIVPMHDSFGDIKIKEFIGSSTKNSHMEEYDEK